MPEQLGKIVQLYGEHSEPIYPFTTVGAVRDAEGNIIALATLDENGKLSLDNIPDLEYVPIARTVNGKSLQSNIELNADDVGALVKVNGENGQVIGFDAFGNPVAKNVDWSLIEAMPLVRGENGQVVGFNSMGDPVAITLAPSLPNVEGTEGQVVVFDANGDPVSKTLGPEDVNALPHISGEDGQYIRFNNGQIEAANLPVGVSSFNGRTGEIIGQNGDYTYDQVGAAPKIIYSSSDPSPFVELEDGGLYIVYE